MWRVRGHKDAVTLATIISLILYLVLRIPAMAAVFEDIGRSSRLLFVVKSVGDIFIQMLGIASVI